MEVLQAPITLPFWGLTCITCGWVIVGWLIGLAGRRD